MKATTVIEEALAFCKSDLKLAEKKYSGLCQIDMLSGEGSQLQETINRLKGEIKAYNWVLTLI
jgi:hypothetical protein